MGVEGGIVNEFRKTREVKRGIVNGRCRGVLIMAGVEGYCE